MGFKKWEEIFEHVLSFGDDYQIKKSSFFSAILCFMSRIRELIYGGWIESLPEIKEFLGCVTVSMIFMFRNEKVRFLKVVREFNDEWRNGTRENFDQEVFDRLFTSFVFNVSLCYDGIMGNRGVSSETLEETFVGFIKIVMMFVSHEEFYNLMMEMEEGKDEV